MADKARCVYFYGGVMSRWGFAIVLIASLAGCSDLAEKFGGGGDPQKQVVGEIVSDQNCPEIAIKITNNSRSTITSTSWKFWAFRKGYSESILEYTETYNISEVNGVRYTDKIIEPGETFVACSTAPMLREQYPANEVDEGVILKNTFADQ